ncbi:hypothetical protein ACFX14_013415 [Malus domestica]
MELSIAHHGKKEPITDFKRDKVFTSRADNHGKKPAKEAFTTNTTPIKTLSAPVKISFNNKAKEIKRSEPSHTQDRYKNTLRELEQKVYPFPDSDMDAMLDDLLEKKVIELPKCKRPEEMNCINDPKYCKYHRIVGHHVGKCFILKELIMKLAQQGRIELDLEDTAATHTTTVVFGSFGPVPLQEMPDHARQYSNNIAPSAPPSLRTSNQDAPKKRSNTTNFPPRQSVMERLEEAKDPFRRRKTTLEVEKIDHLAEKDDVRSSIPLRMKHQAILEVNTVGSLKVKRRTIIHTGQSSCQQAREVNTEEETQDVFHITIQEVEKDEILEEYVIVAPSQLEDGGQATVDDLKELNLGTSEEPKPIFVSALLSADEIEKYYQLLLEYKDVFAWTYKEMPGLDPIIDVHYLAVKPRTRLIKQT